MIIMNIFLAHIYTACAQRSLSIEQALSAVRRFGYEGLECDIQQLQKRERMKSLFDAEGFTVQSIYAHFDFAHEGMATSLRAIEYVLDAADYFGARHILAIPGFSESAQELSAVVAKLAEMCRRASSRNITISVEDFDDSRSPCSTTPKLLWLTQSVEGLGITFDTGNFAYSLENVQYAYDALSRHIVHVHLKDRRYTAICANDEIAAKADMSGRKMYPCPVGEGAIEISRIVDRLKADGYSGSISAEHFGASDQLSCMEKSAHFILAAIGANEK